jgi:hypothetical protein
LVPPPIYTSYENILQKEFLLYGTFTVLVVAVIGEPPAINYHFTRHFIFA